MLQRKLIIRFSLLLGLYATVLLFPWPGLERAYGRLFRGAADVLFHRFWFWQDGHARFLDLRSPHLREDIDLATPGELPPSFAPPAPTEVLDTLVLIMKRSHPSTFGELRISSRAMGYWPTAWLAALILAKPMPWSKRGRALLWGLLLIHLFIAFRLSIKLLAGGFAAAKVYTLFHPGGFWQDVLRRLEEVVVENPTVSFAVPTIVWFIVAFGWGELAALRQSLRGENGDNASADRA